MAGALQQAIDLTKDSQAAASEMVGADPLAASLAAENQKTADAKAVAAQAMAANMEQRDRIAAEPLPVVTAPKYAAMPAKPTMKPGDPLRIFGQFLPVLAALGGLTTRNPAVASLNAATAAMNAAKAQDREALELAHTDWLDNLKLTIETNDQLSREYQAALSDRKATMDDRLARISMLAAKNGDEVTLASLRAGNVAGVESTIKMRDAAAGQLRDVVARTEEQNLAKAKFDEDKRHNRMTEGIAATNAGQMSPGDVVGGILAKMARGEKPTQAELDAVEAYRSLGGSGNTDKTGLQQVLAGLRGTPSPQATGNAGAGSVATSAPPASLLRSGVKTKVGNPVTGKDEWWTLQGGVPKKVG